MYHMGMSKVIPIVNRALEAPGLSPGLAAIAAGIRDRINATAYQTGQDLIRAKSICQHGDWMPFLQAAGIKTRTARELMQYVKLLGDDVDVRALPPVSRVLADHRGKTAESASLKPGPEPAPESEQLELIHQLFDPGAPLKVRRAARMLIAAYLEESQD